MTARDCDALEAERQVLATLVASRHAIAFLGGIVGTADFGAIRHRRLYEAAIARTVAEFSDERVAALAEATDWDEAELRWLLDRPERSCLVDASRYARRVAECARARELDHLLVDIHVRLRERGELAAAVADLRRLVACEHEEVAA